MSKPVLGNCNGYEVQASDTLFSVAAMFQVGTPRAAMALFELGRKGSRHQASSGRLFWLRYRLGCVPAPADSVPALACLN